MKKIIFVAVCIVAINVTGWAQNYGDFRSKASGYWGDYETTWEFFNGSTWTTAPWQPGASDEVITIRSGHTIITDFWSTYTDQCIIQNGGILIVEGTQFKISNGPGTDLDVYGTLIVNGNIATNTNSIIVINTGATIIFGSGGQISNSGNFTLSTGATLVTAHPSGVSGSLTTAGTKSLSTGANYEFNGVYSSQNTGSLIPSTVNNLVINNSNGVALGKSITVEGTLSLTSGLLILGSYNLTISSSASISGTPSATNMIVAVGTGELRKNFASTGSFTFPVGDNTGTAEYSPVTLNFTSGTFTSAYCGVKLSNAKHPNNTSATDYLTRYWTITQSGITDFSCDATFTYVDADINGTESNIFCGSWNGSSWTLLNSANTATNQLTGTVSSFSDYTGGEAGVLPVELTSITASVSHANVQLLWNTATEINNYGFEIERRQIADKRSTITNAQWYKVGFVPGAGTSNVSKEYSYMDSNLLEGRYAYRLKQINQDGSFNYSQSVEVEISTFKEFALNQNYPNPFNSNTSFTFSITQSAFVTLTVFDALGKEVGKVISEQMNPGIYQRLWDASSLPSGVYFYRLQVDQQTLTKKLVLLR